MLWMTIPLVAVFVTMELFFVRYRREDLGWNTAVTNSMVLIFVFIDLLRTVYNQYGWALVFQEELVVRIPLILLVGLLGVVLTVITFYRIIPKEAAFFLASPLTINYIAYFAIVSIYTEIPLDIHTLLVVLSFYCALLAGFWIVKIIFPGAKIAENLPDFRPPLPKLE